MTSDFNDFKTLNVNLSLSIFHNVTYDPIEIVKLLRFLLDHSVSETPIMFLNKINNSNCHVFITVNNIFTCMRIPSQIPRVVVQFVRSIQKSFEGKIIISHIARQKIFHLQANQPSSFTWFYLISLDLTHLSYTHRLTTSYSNASAK